MQQNCLELVCVIWFMIKGVITLHLPLTFKYLPVDDFDITKPQFIIGQWAFSCLFFFKYFVKQAAPSSHWPQQLATGLVHEVSG